MTESSKPRRSILGNLTSRLETEFAEVDAGRSVLPTVSSKGRSAPGHLLEFTGVSRELQMANEELAALRKHQAGGFDVTLSQLRASPYQTGGVSKARVAALVENLRHNPQSSPIVVRETAELGVYEVVAGHHRIEAFRELKRESIRAVLREMSDDEAERLVFYDNLLAPSLSDYDKYLGFAQRQRSRQLTQEQLADEAGVPRANVAKLLAFGRLPPEAQTVVAQNPTSPGVGANLFQALASLEAKYAQRVTEAVQRVVDGKLTASAAAAWVTATQEPREKPAKPVVVKRGAQKFAEVQTRGTLWTVNFSSEADAREYGAELMGLVEQAARK
jgi:ParB family chromosome partitioning protein